MLTRRTLALRLAVASGALGTHLFGLAADAAKVQENDPQAQALDYKVDTTKVSKKKHPTHTGSQECGNCQLFQGSAAAPSGPCPLFGGKHVMAKGWCTAWVKKA